MSDIERKYYVVEGGKTQEAITTYGEKLHGVEAEWDKFQAEFGATGTFSQGDSILGLQFKDNAPPEGWKLYGDVQGHTCFVPDRRTKAGKVANRKMLSLPDKPGSFYFDRLLGLGIMRVKHTGSRSGMALAHAGLEFLCGKHVLSLPADAVNNDIPGEYPFIVPDGCRELLMSEYWAMREADESKAKEQAA